MTVRLPPLLVLTDRVQAERPLIDVVDAAVDGGARAVVLREKDLPPRERARLVLALRALLEPVDGVLLVASDPTLPGDGVHLASRDPFTRSGLAGRSCHNGLALAAAAAEGCDYATLSPIFSTVSKPGYGPPLGTAALTGAPLPTYALGGVTAFNASSCVAAGGSGVAVMGAVMRAARPDQAVAALLTALTGTCV